MKYFCYNCGREITNIDKHLDGNHIVYGELK